jgi:hypothetical protein
VSRQPGLVSQQVGRPRAGSSTTFVYVAPPQAVASIQVPSDDHLQEAVISPEDGHLLKDTWIGHYEMLPPTE